MQKLAETETALSTPSTSAWKDAVRKEILIRIQNTETMPRLFVEIIQKIESEIRHLFEVLERNQNETSEKRQKRLENLQEFIGQLERSDSVPSILEEIKNRFAFLRQASEQGNGIPELFTRLQTESKTRESLRKEMKAILELLEEPQTDDEPIEELVTETLGQEFSKTTWQATYSAEKNTPLREVVSITKEDVNQKDGILMRKKIEEFHTKVFKELVNAINASDTAGAKAAVELYFSWFKENRNGKNEILLRKDKFEFTALDYLSKQGEITATGNLIRARCDQAADRTIKPDAHKAVYRAIQQITLKYRDMVDTETMPRHTLQQIISLYDDAYVPFQQKLPAKNVVRQYIPFDIMAAYAMMKNDRSHEALEAVQKVQKLILEMQKAANRMSPKYTEIMTANCHRLLIMEKAIKGDIQNER